MHAYIILIKYFLVLLESYLISIGLPPFAENYWNCHEDLCSMGKTNISHNFLFSDLDMHKQNQKHLNHLVEQIHLMEVDWNGIFREEIDWLLILKTKPKLEPERGGVRYVYNDILYDTVHMQIIYEIKLLTYTSAPIVVTERILHKLYSFLLRYLGICFVVSYHCFFLYKFNRWCTWLIS